MPALSLRVTSHIPSKLTDVNINMFVLLQICTYYEQIHFVVEDSIHCIIDFQRFKNLFCTKKQKRSQLLQAWRIILQDNVDPIPHTSDTSRSLISLVDKKALILLTRLGTGDRSVVKTNDINPFWQHSLSISNGVQSSQKLSTDPV